MIEGSRKSWDGSVEYLDHLCKKVSDSSVFQTYRNIFRIKEIEESTVLQWTFGAFVLACIFPFSRWATSSSISVEAYTSNNYTCWAYFQECGKWYFLNPLPYGYSQTIFYTALFGLAALSVYLMWRRHWTLAHLTVLPLWTWKLLAALVFSSEHSGNYEYYDLLFGAVLLFIPYKVFFLKLVFVFLYFLAATIKLSDGWLAGTFFTSLELGFPLFGNELAPIFTNIVILMQIVGAWLLLSKNPVLQRLAFCYFLLFHLYSGILVGYRYMITTIPMLIILFGPLYHPTRASFARKTLPGWLLITVMLLLQFLAVFGSPDRQHSLENNRYGLYMFEANHQCISEMTFYRTDATSSHSRVSSGNARNRCDPYMFWFNAKQICTRNPDVKRVSWTFDHSTNGGPFYRIVNTENLCDLSYKPFGHNEWILVPETGAPIVGYPEKNFYR